MMMMMPFFFFFFFFFFFDLFAPRGDDAFSTKRTGASSERNREVWCEGEREERNDDVFSTQKEAEERKRRVKGREERRRYKRESVVVVVFVVKSAFENNNHVMEKSRRVGRRLSPPSPPCIRRERERKREREKEREKRKTEEDTTNKTRLNKGCFLVFFSPRVVCFFLAKRQRPKKSYLFRSRVCDPKKQNTGTV